MEAGNNGERKFVIGANGYAKTFEMDAIDRLIRENHEFLVANARDSGALYPHTPTPRDNNGDVDFSIRSSVMNSGQVQLAGVLSSISDNFQQLIQLLSKVKL